MFRRKGYAAVVACSMLASAGVLRASEPAAADQGLSLSRPLYSAAAAPRKPLMNVLDKMGMAKPLDDAGINIGGLWEGSWTHNFDDPAGNVNAGRVFDFEHDDPTWNQLDVFVEKTVAPSKDKFDLGGRMEWMWGGDARLIHANGVFDHYGVNDGPDEQFDPVQFYLQANLPWGNGVVVTFGKFVTPFGYETINPTTNPLFSHSYLFGFAIPFTHLGVTAKYQLDSNWSATVGVVRGWDQGFEDNNDSHAYFGQVGYTSEKMDVTVGLISGPERTDNERDWRTVLDATVVYRASDQLTLVANGDYGYEGNAASDGSDAHWCGLAGYGMYKFSDMFTLVGRLEYFNDQDGSRGFGATVYEATLGLNIKPLPSDEWGQNLMFRPEIRYDWSNHDVFDGGDDDNQLTFGVDAIFTF